MLRSFIAIELPATLQEAIYQACLPLRQALGSSLVRWVPPQNLHLTLKFLGDVSSANLDLLKQMLRAETERQPPFELEVGTLGSFPNPKRARVIWVGIQAPATLTTLQRNIETAAARLGYLSEERHFSPHLTVGRVSQHATIADQQKIRTLLESTQIGVIGRAQVTSVCLFRSDLQPTGAVYTPLFEAPLRGNHL
ncbi:MAG: RNA 2',3'-cyclic phosphodiesterase [Candidatus Villigracilaceae bacterium]